MVGLCELRLWVCADPDTDPDDDDAPFAERDVSAKPAPTRRREGSRKRRIFSSMERNGRRVIIFANYIIIVFFHTKNT